jgi:hypothetical protein
VALENINSRILASHEFLKTTDYLVITFGTAWAYELVNSGQIVSNCHKVPADQFSRVRLSRHEITEAYHFLLEELWTFNPGLKVVFTVSPIRHMKDGAIENQVSKSTLIMAVDRLRKDFGERGFSYFPAYELMMDELRDYRFYAEDMLHLSPVAIDYIFDRFSRVMLSNESMNISNRILKIRKAVLHRPVNPGSSEYEKFLAGTLTEISSLTLDFPYLNFTEEKAYFEQELAAFKDSED